MAINPIHIQTMYVHYKYTILFVWLAKVINHLRGEFDQLSTTITCDAAAVIDRKYLPARLLSNKIALFIRLEYRKDLISFFNMHRVPPDLRVTFDGRTK